ncbi:MAG TPA: MarR family transcriptional regulator [Acidimicrobiales bacterium]|nr:MarR family transcriptional regulator [Acidimicrobiales bacterium]
MSDDGFHAYFSRIADTRYLVRKVFRLIDEEARNAGLDPLEHQALIQLFGATGRTLQMKDLASRLDVGADVASKTVRSLERKGFALRSRAEVDRRGINVRPTEEAEELLAAIDRRVRADIARLQRGLPRPLQLAALQMFAFYLGLSVDADILEGIEVRPIELSPGWGAGALPPAT